MLREELPEARRMLIEACHALAQVRGLTVQYRHLANALEDRELVLDVDPKKQRRGKMLDAYLRKTRAAA
jgi:hypothetical protein